jgi:tetratricopeptide (TPR) repeat protein
VEFKRAVELDPGSGDIHYRYSALLAAMGRHDEAIAEIIRALELDPLSPRISANLGYRLVFARRHDEAETELTRTLEWAPEYSFAHLYRGYNFAAVGAYDEAIRSYKEAIRHGSLSSSTKAYLGAAYARSGREEVAEKFLNDLLTGEEYASPGELPVLMGALGRNDEAFKSFDRAFESHDLQLQFIKVDPALDPLRGDPRFDDLLARVGLS